MAARTAQAQILRVAVRHIEQAIDTAESFGIGNYSTSPEEHMLRVAQTLEVYYATHSRQVLDEVGVKWPWVVTAMSWGRIEVGSFQGLKKQLAEADRYLRDVDDAED